MDRFRKWWFAERESDGRRIRAVEPALWVETVVFLGLCWMFALEWLRPEAPGFRRGLRRGRRRVAIR